MVNFSFRTSLSYFSKNFGKSTFAPTDLRDLGVTAFRCWKPACGGFCKVLTYMGMTKYSNLANPVGLAKVGDFVRTWTFAPRIQCALPLERTALAPAPSSPAAAEPVSYTHLTLPTTPYV